jgi:hypothetical protein
MDDRSKSPNSPKSPVVHGGMLSLVKSGPQDAAFMNLHYDPKALLHLPAEDGVCSTYGHDYGTLPLDDVASWCHDHDKPAAQIVMKIAKSADLLTDVSLVITNPQRRSMNELLTAIGVEIGGQRMDWWHSRAQDGEDIQTLIESCCALYGRRVEQIGEKTIVPLVLAPFNVHNLFPLVALNRHDLVVNVRFDGDPLSIELWGRRYFLEVPERRSVTEMNHDFLVFQTSFAVRNGPSKPCAMACIRSG